MPFWIGVNNIARKVIAPYIGVGGKARRVMKGYIGVGGKARVFYDYLDDIDHIEVAFTGVSLLTNTSSEGGTMVASGKSAFRNAGGVLALDGANVTFGLGSSVPAVYTAYFYWKIRVVLKGDCRISLNYPRVNDSKTGVCAIATSNYSHTGSYWWYPYIYDGTDWMNDQPPYSYSYNYVSDSCLLRQTQRVASGSVQCKYTFGNVTFNGRTYTPTFVDEIPA